MVTTLEPEGGDCLIEVPIRLSLIEADRLLKLIDRAKHAVRGLTDGQRSSDAKPEQLAAFASFLLDARRRREQAFPDIDFGEPAWDMLLDLYVRHVERRRVCVSSLCTAAVVPPTTALRWIDAMVSGGIFKRERDARDGRRTYVRLAEQVTDALERYLSDMRDRAWRAIQ